MKQKININITIDTEIYLKARTKEGFNISGECNEFLKKRLGTTTQNIKELEEQATKTKAELEFKEMEIERLKKEEAKEAANLANELAAKEKAELEAIPTGNNFQDRLTREKIFKEKPELEQKWLNATSAAK